MRHVGKIYSLIDLLNAKEKEELIESLQRESTNEGKIRLYDPAIDAKTKKLIEDLRKKGFEIKDVPNETFFKNMMDLDGTIEEIRGVCSFMTKKHIYAGIQILNDFLSNYEP